MFNPDKAIKSCKEDELNRCKFAKSLGNAIYNYKIQDCLVIGLIGKWGYGKTSIINMAIEHVKKCSKDDDKPPIIIEFNPWIFSNQNQLVKKFFDELGLNIQDKTIKKKLKSYVNKLIPPIMGIASIIDPNRAQALYKTAEYVDDLQSDEESLESTKKDINYLIKEKNQKIIVIIDDIDRLYDFEIIQIFQLVKLIADFPNTIYFLSFDRDVVVEALGKVQQSSGEKYLEKVIQIPFEVPKIHDADIARLLFDQIYELIHHEEERFEQKRWWNFYYDGLKYYFTNIRDINRYINSLKLNFHIIKKDVNIVDFLVISCIEVFESDVYYGIRDNKDLFAGIYTFQVSGASTNPKQELAKNRCEKIIRNTEKESKTHLKSLLINLFPKLNALYANTNYGSDWLSGWRKNLRICSEDHFDTYFNLSIPKDEISQGRIESILSLTNEINSFENALLELDKEGKIVRFLERMEDYTSEIPKSDIKNVIGVLMDIGDIIDGGYAGLMQPDSAMRILRIIYQLINRFKTQEERFKIFKSSIENAKQSIYPMVHEISTQDQEHGKYGFSEKPLETDKNRTVSPDQLNKLEKLVCKKINEWAKNGKLIKNRKLGDILYVWKEWESKETVEKFVNDSIKNEQGLIDFITGFTEKTSSWNSSDRFENVFWRINLKYMKNFIDPQEIEPRVSRIASSSRFEHLNENNKRAIELFLKDFND